MSFPDHLLIICLLFALRRLKLIEETPFGDLLDIFSKYVCLKTVERCSPELLVSKGEKSKHVIRELLKGFNVK